MKASLLSALLFAGYGLFASQAYSRPEKCTSIFEDGTKTYENCQIQYVSGNIYSITRRGLTFRIGENGWIPDPSNKYCIKNLESGTKFCLDN